MGIIRYLYQATRDVIGGAFGGLLAAWVLTDIPNLAISGLGVVIVLLLAAVYYIFEQLTKAEEDVRSESGSGRDETLNNWTLHRAS